MDYLVMVNNFVLVFIYLFIVKLTL